MWQSLGWQSLGRFTQSHAAQLQEKQVVETLAGRGSTQFDAPSTSSRCDSMSAKA